MSVRYLYIKADGSLNDRRPYTAGCFGNILSNSSVMFGEMRNPVVRLDNVIAVRVYNPMEINWNAPIPNFSDGQVAAMREMMDTHPAVFEPVTLTPEYYEIRTDIPSDQFWFCMNNLRFAYRNENNGELYQRLKQTLGVWRATMLYNGFTFRRAIGERVFTVGEGFNDGITAMWSGKEATESFVEDLLLDPMKLLGKKDPIAALPEMSMYPYGYVGDCSIRNPFYMNTFLRVGHQGKNIRFKEVIAAMQFSDKELEELKTFLSF